MADQASVSDLIAVLELGTASGDTDLADKLRSAFGVAPGADLANALEAVPPGDVLAALASAVAPVARMVHDLYAWLGRLADVRSTANLSVRVTDAQIQTMDLDPSRYEAYEQTIVEEVSRTEFDPSLLSPDSKLLTLHDSHWKPSCLDGTIPPSARCKNCRPGVAAEYRELEQLLRVAVAAMSDDDMQADTLVDGRTGFLEDLARLLPKVTSRVWSRPECPYSIRFFADYLRLGLPDLIGCFRDVSAQQLKRFFDLPYWKARWQVYELWILRLVLDSYDTSRWIPALTDGAWDLKAGSTNPEAIATAQLIDGTELRCYYQHESVPPASLFPGLRDRPELLVTLAQAPTEPASPGTDIEPVLLAVEAKARSNYGPQDLKSATLPLLEWRPRRVLGASYFTSTGTDQLHVQQFAGTPVGVAEALVPGSASGPATTEWLVELWQELPRPQVTIIAGDISRSMPPRAAKKHLQAMAELARNVPRPRWADSLAGADLLFLSTFGGPTPGLRLLREFSAEAIAKARIQLAPGDSGQDLERAVAEWQAGLGNVPAHRINLYVHLITDGRWTDNDLVALESYRLAGARVHLHLVDAPAHPRFREELRPLVVE
ncbi:MULTISPECIES: VWA domain-containing protein [Amycolatopsis]|uniref:VWA domain-containing protein n=1 Tax=Amycolatopsis TaxID=1813 RepID=UPI00039D6ED0|nr:MULTISPECIES: VWA domain-containing protein [Amycolatopsis]